MIKTLVEQADLTRKWLGFFLMSTTLDPSVCLMNETLFNKMLNGLINAVSNTINKNELLTDHASIALQAFRVILSIMHKNYDQKQHSIALTVIKQILQNLVKKMDKALKII